MLSSLQIHLKTKEGSDRRNKMKIAEESSKIFFFSGIFIQALKVWACPDFLVIYLTLSKSFNFIFSVCFHPFAFSNDFHQTTTSMSDFHDFSWNFPSICFRVISVFSLSNSDQERSYKFPSQ